MYLFFDTETTGANKAQDRTVQIAWLLCNERGGVEKERNYVIKPSGFSISPKVTKIHGISQTSANQHCYPLKEVLKEFIEDLDSSRLIVGHNIDFDIAIIRNDLSAIGLPDAFGTKRRICTMRASTEWCRILNYNGNKGYKWPKLEELFYRLFGHYFDGAHDALVDTQITKKCFFELMNLGVISADLVEELIPDHRNSIPNGGEDYRVYLKTMTGTTLIKTCLRCRAEFRISREGISTDDGYFCGHCSKGGHRTSSQKTKEPFTDGLGKASKLTRECNICKAIFLISREGLEVGNVSKCGSCIEKSID